MSFQISGMETIWMKEMYTDQAIWVWLKQKLLPILQKQ